MINFEMTEEHKNIVNLIHELSENTFRPLSKKYDSYEHEHDQIKELEAVAAIMRQGRNSNENQSEKKKGGRRSTLMATMVIEELCWGDVGLMLALPGMGLGNAAISAVGTPEQKKRFKNYFASMAITEPGCGSDSSAIKTRAELDPKTNEWILNG